GLIQTQYDALGRLTQTTKQDGSLAAVQYDKTSANSTNGTCAITTDEAGKSRKSCVDALGRLIEVDEPQASAVGTSATASVTISGNWGSGVTGTVMAAAMAGTWLWIGPMVCSWWVRN